MSSARLQLILHDDVAAYTARIQSNARLAVMQFNDNLATRRALDQRPRPLREFSVGDEVAVWRRSTGKGALGKQRRAQWRGPGIILGAVRGNYFVAMPWSVIKAAPEQLRTQKQLKNRRLIVLCFGIFGVPRMFCVNPVRQRISKTSRNRIGQTVI